MQVKALEAMYYGGRERARGEVFATELDEHARLLILNGMVEEVAVVQEKKPQRGQYRRRDMRADE